MKLVLICTFFFSLSVKSFVSGPSTIDAGYNYISFGTQVERGKVEPNENRSSFQNAQINIHKLKYIHGLDGFLGLNRSNLNFEFGSFTKDNDQYLDYESTNKT